MLNLLQLSETPEYWEFSKRIYWDTGQNKSKNIFWHILETSKRIINKAHYVPTFSFLLFFEKEKAIKNIIMIHGR